MGIALNGSSQYFKFADAAIHSWPNSDWTVSFWLKVASLPASGVQFVLSHDYDDLEEFASIYVNNSDDSMVAYWGCGVGNGDVYAQSAAGSVVLNTWQHWTIAREGGSLKIFLMGALVATSTPVTFGACNPATDVFFGVRDNLTGSYLHGTICEFARWNRSLRSDEKYSLLYFSPALLPTSLVWYAPLQVAEPYETRNPLAITYTGSPTVADSISLMGAQ